MRPPCPAEGSRMAYTRVYAITRPSSTRTAGALSQSAKKKDRRLACPVNESRSDIFYCSKPSYITGNCSFALASDFKTIASADCDEVLRAVAISLTSKYVARCSIFFSRKESGLLRLREQRLLRTTATSRREPVRMRSEFSLKR